MDSWYRHGLMIQTWIYGIDMDSWYRHGPMVLTTPMVLSHTHGTVLVLVNHTQTRGLRVAHMHDLTLQFLHACKPDIMKICVQCGKVECSVVQCIRIMSNSPAVLTWPFWLACLMNPGVTTLPLTGPATAIQLLLLLCCGTSIFPFDLTCRAPQNNISGCLLNIPKIC